MRLWLMFFLVSCKLQPNGSALREEVALPNLNWQDCRMPPPPRELVVPEPLAKPDLPLLLARIDLVFARIRGENNSKYQCKACHGGSDIFALATVLHPASTAERISDGRGKIDADMVRDFLESLARMPPIIQGARPDEQFGPGLTTKEQQLLDQWIKEGAPVCRQWGEVLRADLDG